jgi:phosphoglucomutase
MRGIMGSGINRMNRYTYGKATQGLSQYLIKKFPDKEIKVAIGYDCRHNSDTFARIVADVLTANGIKVFLFEEMRPTPELSFAVRHLGCQAGIVLTASHNPPEYNGYKVYWNDGGQIVPPEDKEIVEEIAQVNFSDILFEAREELLEFIGKEIDEAFWEASLQHGRFPGIQSREKLVIVFTSIHGTSIKLIPEVLRRAGYNQVHIVEEQARSDGDFPTVKSPIPKNPKPCLWLWLWLIKYKPISSWEPTRIPTASP